MTGRPGPRPAPSGGRSKSISGYESPEDLPPTPLSAPPAAAAAAVPPSFSVPPRAIRRTQTEHAAARAGGSYFPVVNSPAASLNGAVMRARNMTGQRKVGLRERIGCYQWTWFTMTMATGGIANVLHSQALFWIYVGVSTLVSAGLYLTLWSTQVFPIHTMTPIWVFPAYPLLLTAPFGGNLVSAANSTGRLDAINTVAVAMAAVTVQGTGYLISFMISAAFLYRLMTQKLPRDDRRPGVFISIGPGGFTAAGIVQLGSQAADIFPADFMGTAHAVPILRVLAYMTGLWLWGLSIWFFLVSVGSLWKYLRPEHRARLRFQMTWFSFVFPNTALVTATVALGTAFESAGLKVLSCVLAGCLVVVWILVFTQMLRCLWRKELLWPKEED
ncbi:hypothetical protein VTK56DRAFT_10062 [Thermocarpiscus australiensis]